MVIKKPDVLPTEPPKEARSLPKHQLHVVAEPDHVDGDGLVNGVEGENDVDGVGGDKDGYDLLTP